MNKKLATVSVSILAVIAIGSTALLVTRPKFKVVTKENFKTEYGMELKKDSLFDKDKSDKNVNVKSIEGFDNKKIGKQTITVTFSNGDKTIDEKLNIEVSDTKKPVIELAKEKLTITIGDKLDLSKAVKNVSDPIDDKLKYSDKAIEKDGYYFVTDKVDTKKAGTYKAQVIAIDKNGNKSTADIEVTVNKKENKTDASDKVASVDKVNKPSTHNNSGNNQTSTPQYNESVETQVNRPSAKPNQPSSKPSSKPSQKPSVKPSQPVKPHVHDFGYTGHDDAVFVGPVFDDKYECMDWSDTYDNPDWAGWGYTTCQCSCGKWRTYCFNIDYKK